MNIRYANEKELKTINHYFEETGVYYTKDDNIAVFESPLDVAYYLYQDNLLEMLHEMKIRTPIDESMDLVQNLVDDLISVFKSPDDGRYYVIK